MLLQPSFYISLVDKAGNLLKTLNNISLGSSDPIMQVYAGTIHVVLYGICIYLFHLESNYRALYKQ
jgi:hypothetical protein